MYTHSLKKGQMNIRYRRNSKKKKDRKLLKCKIDKIIQQNKPSGIPFNICAGTQKSDLKL